MCKLKITASTLTSGFDTTLKGGYKTQLVPAPTPIVKEEIINIKEGNNNHKLKLFKRGYLISGAPNIVGRIQLPNPPTRAGMTIKKIINKAWRVKIVL